jgi:mRNA interferase MazF
VARPSGGDPKRFRGFVVVSRQVLIDSRFSTVVDELISLPKSVLTHFFASLPPATLAELDRALAATLGIEVSRLRGDEQ